MASGEVLERKMSSGVLIGVQFDLMIAEDIEKSSAVSVVETSDVTNSKLGLPNISSECTTCSASNIRECDGHSGVIKLPATVYHPYLISELVQILNQICPGCKSIKRDVREKGSRNLRTHKSSAGKHAYQLEASYQNFLKKLVEYKLQLPACDLDSAIKSRDKFLKNFLKGEEGRESCKYCYSGTEWYPAVKFKVSSENVQGKKILIVAEVVDKFPRKFKNNGLSEELPKDYWSFLPRYSDKQESNLKRISLSPSQVFDMLKQLHSGFIEQFVRRKEFLFLSCIPVTPNSHRVMEAYRPCADGPQLSYDECTKACKRVVDISRKIGEFQRHEQFGVLAPSFTASRVQDYLNASKDASDKDGKSPDLTREGSSSGSRLAGEPVGLLAACSITEAAYGAVDLPMLNLEASPLLNLKEVLECRLGTSAHKTVTLFLSNKLERWNYGFEYGSLQVKNHLERVFFSDIVTAVTIVYAGHEVDGTKFSPWISHFHLRKECMIRKGISTFQVIEEILANYNSIRLTKDVTLPILSITSKDCSVADIENEAYHTNRITVSFETSQSDIQLDAVRDVLIPVLLQTVIKGFFEFTKVEILSDTSQNHGKPFLKVTSTKNYSSRKFWDAIINACIPVMDLIDWECSHPDGISDVFNTFGIDAAWRYFLGLLKTSISDIGRDLHREHLITVANTLSVTGEFHGLSFKGLKQQRIHASVSSPVSQAFFSSPNTQFISAAKQGSIDNLLGAVDAVSWGKEPQIGTGGQFEIIYSGKVNELKKVDNIYKSLHSLKQDNPCQKQNELSKPSEHICAKWGRMKGLDGKLFPNGNLMEVEVNGFESVNHVSTQSKEHAISGFESKFSLHDVGTLSDVVEMHSSLSRILHNMYKIDEYLNEADKSFVVEALTYHPKGDKKLGAGIRKIKVGRSPTHPGSRCFILIRTDGTIEDMSYRKCVIGAAERISPECGSMIKKELNHRR